MAIEQRIAWLGYANAIGALMTDSDSIEYAAGLPSGQYFPPALCAWWRIDPGAKHGLDTRRVFGHQT